MYGAGAGPFPFGQGVGEGPGGAAAFGGGRASGRLRRPAAGRAARARRRPPGALRPYGADGFYILPVAGKEEILYDRIA